MLIDASSLKLFESLLVPSSKLVIEFAELDSDVFESGKTVAFEVNVTGLNLAYNPNNKENKIAANKIMKRYLLNLLKIALVNSEVVKIICFLYL